LSKAKSDCGAEVKMFVATDEGGREGGRKREIEVSAKT
jgi:hypothetical protein